MAYQFFGTSHSQIDLCSIPDSTRPSFTTDIPAAISLPNVKEEFLGSVTDKLQQSGTPLPRPAKKQKLAEEGRSHRFVSQKKWKFSDAQPWLPSKVSSKAQNASKTSNKAKTEPASPRISSSSSIVPDVVPANAGTAHLESHNIHNPTSNVTRRQKCTDISASPESNQEDASSLQSPSHTTSLAETRSNIASSSAASSLSVAPSISRTNELILEIDAQVSVHAQSDPSSTPDTTFQSAAHATLLTPRSSKCISALSLEKDAERIAALIAEKRKENESSMFRERMLERQLQHKTYRGSRHTSQEEFPAQPASPQQPRSNTLSDAANPAQRSPSNSSSGTVALSQRYLPSRFSVDNSGYRDIRNTADSSTPGQSLTAETDSSTRKGNPFPSTSLMSELRNPPSHNGHEILFGRQPSSQVSLNGMQVQPRKCFGVAKIPIQSQNRIPSFELDNSNSTNQCTAFHNRAAQGFVQDVQNQNVSDVRHMRPQYYSRQGSNSLPTAQPVLLRRTSSTTSLHRQSSVEASIASVPPPMRISSRSPTSMSIRHFSQIDISTQPQTCSVAHPPASDRVRPTSMGQMSVNAAAYYATNRQMWTSSDQQTDAPMSNQAVHSGSLSRSSVASAPFNAATTKEQRYPQTQVLASHTNMFSGNSRSSAVLDPESVLAKPRVNMFGNTTGTAFPMQEVIRQIEMT